MLGLRLRGFPAWFAARTYHLAMMPGVARKVRLGARLDRGPAVRPRLGRARPARSPGPALDDPRRARSGRERPGSSARAARATCARRSTWARRPRTPRARSAACCRADQRRGTTTTRRPVGARAGPARVHRRPGRRRVRDLRGRRRDGRLRARRALRRDGRADRAVGRAVARRARAGPGAARALLAGVARRPSSGGWCSGWAGPRDLTLYTRVRRDAGRRPLAHAPPRRGVPRAPLAGVDATEPTVHALTPERAVAEWKRLEPPAIGHERPLLHEFFGRTRTCLAHDGRRARRGDARCAGSAPTATSARRWAETEDLVPVVLAALDRVAKQQEPETLRGVLHHRLLVAARPAAPARLPRALAELGDELGAAAGPRPLPADPPGAAPLDGTALATIEHGTVGLGRRSQARSPSGALVAAYSSSRW